MNEPTALDRIVTLVMIYLPLTGTLLLAIQVLWRGNRLITRIKRVMANHPPHTHNTDGSITYDPDWPPPINVPQGGHH